MKNNGFIKVKYIVLVTGDEIMPNCQEKEMKYAEFGISLKGVTRFKAMDATSGKEKSCMDRYKYFVPYSSILYIKF